MDEGGGVETSKQAGGITASRLRTDNVARDIDCANSLWPNHLQTNGCTVPYRCTSSYMGEIGDSEHTFGGSASREPFVNVGHLNRLCERVTSQCASIQRCWLIGLYQFYKDFVAIVISSAIENENMMILVLSIVIMILTIPMMMMN